MWGPWSEVAGRAHQVGKAAAPLLVPNCLMGKDECSPDSALGTGECVVVGLSWLRGCNTTRVHQAMESLCGVVSAANMLVCMVASLGALTFQGPGQAEGIAIVLGNDVQELSCHHRADG